MSIELYIKNRLCDINSPESLGIRLKRQFINPAELSVKDAQMSYEITLPATPNNNEIFSHVNVEEVQGKFRIYEDARLYVDGILILDGKFRLSEITQDSYKGNLGVPAPLTAKDIFGETMMNQAGKWLIPFTGVDDITRYNTGGHDKSVYGEISPCIFPLVLYGLLPKYSDSSNYSNKNIYDTSVNFKMDDFLPSVNCIHMLKQIFKNAGYTLTGNALDDERIKNLYVSYKNPENYELSWGAGLMKVEGKWGNLKDDTIEKRYAQGEFPGNNKAYISSNIFESNNISDLRITDSGSNIITSKKDQATKILFKAPLTGLYKLELDVALKLEDKRKILGSQHMPRPSVSESTLNKSKIEIKVVRHVSDYKKLREEVFDNSFFKNNQLYESDKEGALYPREGGVNFIDPKQNSSYICGFSWGYEKDFSKAFYNPASSVYHNPMAIKGGESWDKDIEGINFSAVESAGYTKRTGTGFTDVDDLKVELIGIPEDKKTRTKQTDNTNASGHISQVIWLEKGECLSLISTSLADLNPYAILWPNHSVDFSLTLSPFKRNRNWLTVTINGNSDPEKKPMNWNDQSSFTANEIDLIQALPIDIKINDWIENFCKTFNLSIINRVEKSFELNIKNNNLVNDLSQFIDLDKKTSIKLLRNEPLRLPYLYEIGFSTDTSEEGYYSTMEDEIDSETGYKTGEKIVNSGKSGKGIYYTGSTESNKLTETFAFSYCWYKELEDKINKEILNIPVITDYEVWLGDIFDYEEMSEKSYTDKTQRFWYKSDIKEVMINQERAVSIALVANKYNGQRKLTLDYEDNKDSIIQNFFLLLTNNDNDYTVVECRLTAEEYSKLDKTLVKLNGDLYHIAEVDGYDPLGKSSATLRLIRRII